MPIAVRCACGNRFSAPDTLAGKRVKCPECGQPVAVAEATGSLTLKCQCGKPLKVPVQMAGKAVKCPACGKGLRVPASAQPAAATRAAASERSGEDSVGALLDEVDLNLSKTGRRCPECREDMELDDIICVHCGYNTETGKKIRVKKAEPRKRFGSVVLHEDASAASVRIPDEVQALIKLLNQAGVLALLTAVAIVAYLGYRNMQADPQLGVDAFVTALTGPGLYIIGVAVALVVVPSAIATKLLEKASPAGRILSLIVGFISLLGFPLVTLIGVLIIRLALSHDIQRYCR